MLGIPGGLVVRIQRFYYPGLGSVSGQGSEILPPCFYMAKIKINKKEHMLVRMWRKKTLCTVGGHVHWCKHQRKQWEGP